MKKHILIILIVTLLIVSCSPSGNSGIFHINSDGSILLKKEGIAVGDIIVPSTVNGQSVKSLANQAFYDSYRLKSVTLPDTITLVGARAFSGCTALASVNLGKGVTSIEVEAFADCKSLSSITLPDGVKTIEEKTFHDCIVLAEVVLPKTLETIKGYAFEGCGRLKSLEIPSTVTKIDGYAFRYCTSLTEITYASTKDNWNKISFGSQWKTDCPIKTVHCTDGDITL